MISDDRIKEISYTVPKSELHIHIEGTFEPELMFEIANRNNISIPYKSVEEVKAKYQFSELRDFLNIYYEACSVLVHEKDFHDLTYEYLKRSSAQGLKYAEIFFDPQTHLSNNVPFKTFFNGLVSGTKQGYEDFGVESQLIMCFLRDRSEEEAIQVFEQALEFKSQILGVGLDSNEVGNLPEKFKNVFKMAKEHGFRITAHAGEEAPPEYIVNAIEHLGVERIDHGCSLVRDSNLIRDFAKSGMALTMCPLSNSKLQVTPDLSKHMLKGLLDQGVKVMINSDDPAYFGGYVGDNYLEIWKGLKLSYEEIIKLSKNSFDATFLNDERKKFYLDMVEEFYQKNKN